MRRVGVGGLWLGLVATVPEGRVGSEAWFEVEVNFDLPRAGYDRLVLTAAAPGG